MDDLNSQKQCLTYCNQNNIDRLYRVMGEQQRKFLYKGVFTSLRWKLS